MDHTKADRQIFTTGIVMLAIGAALALLVTLGACSATAGATRAVRTLQQLRDLSAKQLAAMVHSRHLDCLQKHGTRTPEYAACIKEPRAWLKLWQEALRPAANSAAAVGVAALQTEALVVQCKAAKNCTKVILALMKPGVCALTRGVRSWAHKLPDKGASVLGVVKLLGGVTCQP